MKTPSRVAWGIWIAVAAGLGTATAQPIGRQVAPATAAGDVAPPRALLGPVSKVPLKRRPTPRILTPAPGTTGSVAGGNGAQGAEVLHGPDLVVEWAGLGQSAGTFSILWAIKNVGDAPATFSKLKIDCEGPIIPHSEEGGPGFGIGNPGCPAFWQTYRYAIHALAPGQQQVIETYWPFDPAVMTLRADIENRVAERSESNNDLRVDP